MTNTNNPWRAWKARFEGHSRAWWMQHIYGPAPQPAQTCAGCRHLAAARQISRRNQIFTRYRCGCCQDRRSAWSPANPACGAFEPQGACRDSHPG